jgi:hypothetical protein
VLFNDILNGRRLGLGWEGLLTTSDSDEVLHLLFRDEAAVVLVHAIKEDGELIISNLGLFTQLCKDILDESLGLSLVELTAFIGIIPGPDLVH